MKKIKWEYGIWKEWLPELRKKIWYYDDGCWKILKVGKDKKWTLRIGFHDIARFKNVEDAKKVAQMIKNG